MFEELMWIKSLLGLLIVVSILIGFWWLSRKNIGNFWQKFNANSNMKISNFIILPNRSQLIHLDDQRFQKTYLLLVQSNGEVKLMDSKEYVAN